jgi:hypothetical protein
MTDIPAFPRDVLAASFNNNPRMITAFEQLLELLVGTLTTVEGASSAVVSLAATEFILAAASEGLTNGRVLADGRGITITYGSGTATISHPIEVDGGEATFLLTGDTNLILPTIGTVATTADIAAYIASAQDYANDAAAAAGGVPIGGIYRTASALKVRVT